MDKLVLDIWLIGLCSSQIGFIIVLLNEPFKASHLPLIIIMIGKVCQVTSHNELLNILVLDWSMCTSVELNQ